MSHSDDPIRVMIVDDYDMLRVSLRFFLQSLDDLEVVGEARNGQDAIELCAVLKPDVILMDVKMPGMDGVAATRTIRRTYPEVQVVGLTSFSDEDWLGALLQAGAAGLLTKNISIDDIAAAIKKAHRGDEGRPVTANGADASGDNAETEQ